MISDTRSSKPFAHLAAAASLTVLALYVTPADAAEPFADKALSEQANTLEQQIRTKPATSVKRTAREWKAEADKLLAPPLSNPREAAAALQQAVQLEPANADYWLALANAFIAIKPDTYLQDERGRVQLQTTAAAYRAYERAKTDAQRTAALDALAEGLKRRAQYRSALTVYATALGLSDTAARRAAYEALRNEHGFRVTDTRVDADAAAPQACVVFSERLAGGDIDWSNFIKVDGKTATAVRADGKQICVDGLAHGRTYQVSLRAGLPSVIAGEPLMKSSDLTIYVRDRSPSVRGAAKAYVLPAAGQQGIPLTTTNVDLLGIEVYRVGDRALATLLNTGDMTRTPDREELGNIRERSGQKVYSGELEVAAKVNEEVTTAFPVSEAIGKMQPGVYVLSARVLPRKSGDDRGHASQWFIVSDLGLSTYSGNDGLHAFVRSLTTAASVANAKVRLVAKNNEVLANGTTDARGYVRFDAGIAKGEGGLAPQMLAVETADGDYAFLDMSATAFDLTDRGVKGRAAPGPVDAFAYTDRGVYRPGETVQIAALVRDAAVKSSMVPVTMIVTRPDGVEYRRLLLPDQGLGGRHVPLTLGGNAMGGTWRAKVYTDPKADPLATVSFLVEDYVPERMDLKLEAETAAITLDGGKIRVAGKYLYGPPAAGLDMEGEIVVKPSKAGVAAFPGYQFGRADEKITPVREKLEIAEETAADGTASVAIKLPKLEPTARALDADVMIRLKETGGRTIERTITMPVDFKEPRIGIKSSFADNQAQEGDTVRFDVVQVDGAGKAIAANGLKWELVKLEQRWQWFSRGGSWSYDMQTLTRRVANGTVDTDAGKPGVVDAKLDWGRYRLEVKSADGTPAALTNIEFNAGWQADEAAESPEMLDLALDKPTYKAGETARVKVTSRFAGTALVSVLNGGVVSFKEAQIPVGGGEVPIEVADNWGPGAYVAVTLFRPLDGPAKRMPGRAIGLRWVAVDQGPRSLKVSIEAPDKVKPGQKLTVPVKLAGLASGESARVTVAAVDVGILNLTRFDAPKPEGWFFGQRKLGLDVRDYYSRLIDGMRAEKGRLRSGGDGADGGGMSSTGSPPVEAPLALFSGIVTVGADGVAQVPLDLPDFNGTVRLSAVAWTDNKLGSSSRDMIVRDQLAVTVSAPRFLTLGDSARLQLDVHNIEGPAAPYKLTVTFTPPAGIKGEAVALVSRTLDLKAGEKRADVLELKPGEIGAMPLEVALAGPNGLSVKRSLQFDVKPPGGDVKRVTVSQLAGNGGKVTLSKDLFMDLIPSTAKATVHVGPLASLDVAGILNQLDRYPYGCAEQTTSRALPLLYANDLARQIGLGQDRDLKDRVQKAVERVLEMQDASGAFGIWGPSDGDIWLSSYVTDFLLRAKEASITVDPRALKTALDRLQNFVAYAQDFEKGGEERAYAIYVLARAGRAPVGDLRYFIDGRIDRFATALSLAHLGAAASLVGDKPRAELAFAAAMRKLDGAESSAYRHDYGTALRDRAAVMTLASETKVVAASTPQMVDVLAKAYQSKSYTSTQEQAWLLLAARSVSDQADAASLNVDGVVHKGRLVRSLSMAEMGPNGLTIANTAEAATNAVISVIGSALTPEPAVSRGFTVTRSYFTLDGKPVDLASAKGGQSTLKQNDRLVAVVKVEASDKGGRILLVDRLPAGLEIENPRLVEGGDTKSLDWLKTETKPEHTEFRDDRFVAAFNFFGSDSRNRRGDDDGDAGKARGPVATATVAYIVRAVTPGTFVHPAATVEDMYRPDRLARTATGKLAIVAK